MCRVLGVSESGFHAWSGRGLSERARSDAVLVEQIAAFHAASHGTYGSPRIHADLNEAGVRVGRKRVARLMRAAGLFGVSRRRFVVTTTRDGARPSVRPPLHETGSGPHVSAMTPSYGVQIHCARGRDPRCTSLHTQAEFDTAWLPSPSGGGDDGAHLAEVGLGSVDEFAQREFQGRDRALSHCA